jgi:hypothetical protein
MVKLGLSIGGVAVVTATLVLWLWPRCGVTVENYYRIYNGMKEQEVLDLLGRPPDYDGRDDLADFLKERHALDTIVIAETFDSRSWHVDENTMISVHFDKEARVIDKHLWWKKLDITRSAEPNLFRRVLKSFGF